MSQSIKLNNNMYWDQSAVKDLPDNIGTFSKVIAYSGNSFDSIPTGMYTISNGSSMTNVPANADYWYVLSFNNRHQFAWPTTGSQVYHRWHSNVNDPWGAWYQIDQRNNNDLRVYQNRFTISANGSLTITIPGGTYGVMFFVSSASTANTWAVVGFWAITDGSIRMKQLSDSSLSSQLTFNISTKSAFKITSSAGYSGAVFTFSSSRLT